MFRTAIISGALIGFTSVGGVAISAVHGVTFEAGSAPTPIVTTQAQATPAQPEPSTSSIAPVQEVSRTVVESPSSFKVAEQPASVEMPLRPRARPSGLGTGQDTMQLADNSQSRVIYVPVSKPDPKPTFLLGVYR